MHTIHELLERLWNDYRSLNPHADAIHDLLNARGEKILNDHIAFRTFDFAKVNIDRLAAPFVERGYHEAARYRFEEKKLDARHYEHADATLPKVFISELRTSACSKPLQAVARDLVAQVSDEFLGRWDFVASGRPWTVSYATYAQLAAESEYAAWLSAFGFRANHFTVNVNALKSIDGLGSLNALLKANGFSLNDGGGEIKGSPDVYLEQSSTRANEVMVEFSDGSHAVPACYYEFAKRYPLPDGKLFQGFVEKSANKIFESTDRR